MSDKSTSLSKGKQRVLVLGSSGRLGSCLINSEIFESEFELIRHSRSIKSISNADLTDRTKTFEMLKVLKPNVIVNTVALAEIEACEKDPNRAFRTNVLTVQNLVEWISESKKSCHLVHISTDHLYDDSGAKKEDFIKLTNYYAFSKFASELVARQVPSTILRTNFVGKSSSNFRQTFSDWFVGYTRSDRTIEVVNDIWFSPVTLQNLSFAISVACTQKPSLTANFGSRGEITKYDLCSRVLKGLNLNLEKVSSVTAEECMSYVTYRPKNMVMDSSLWESVTGTVCPTIDNVISALISEYR
jgi:dTDP-4-dehydrorhamnose reductase